MYVLICLAVPIVFALIVTAIIIWRLAQRRQCRREAEQYVRRHDRVPDDYYGRELVRAYYARHFDLPDNFPELGEPNFSVHRLGWFLGMVEQLGPSAILNCSYLRPNARPGTASQVSTREFWLDFDFDGRRWVIWFPGKDYEIVERLWFGNHCVSSTSARRTHDEIASWLRRSRVLNSESSSAAPQGS